MARRADNKSLRKLDRLELLELLVEQGEQLERAQEALAAAETRATQQERIARLAEDAISRLAGILEAAQLVQFQYSTKLRELKAEMGLKTETTFNKDEFSVGIDKEVLAEQHMDEAASQIDDIEDFDAADFIQNTLGISTDDATVNLEGLGSADADVSLPDYESVADQSYASSELPGGGN